VKNQSKNSLTLYPLAYKLTMRNPGLEPGSLAAHEPESCASTNSASPASNYLYLLGFVYSTVYNCCVSSSLCQGIIEFC
jgi:hypothetical protein